MKDNCKHGYTDCHVLQTQYNKKDKVRLGYTGCFVLLYSITAHDQSRLQRIQRAVVFIKKDNKPYGYKPKFVFLISQKRQSRNRLHAPSRRYLQRDKPIFGYIIEHVPFVFKKYTVGFLGYYRVLSLKRTRFCSDTRAVSFFSGLSTEHLRVRLQTGARSAFVGEKNTAKVGYKWSLVLFIFR